MEKLTGAVCNCCNIARCIWCPKPAPSEETIKFEAVLAKLEQMEEKVRSSFSPYFSKQQTNRHRCNTFSGGSHKRSKSCREGEKKVKLDKFHLPQRIKTKLQRRKKQKVSFGDEAG